MVEKQRLDWDRQLLSKRESAAKSGKKPSSDPGAAECSCAACAAQHVELDAGSVSSASSMALSRGGRRGAPNVGAAARPPSSLGGASAHPPSSASTCSDSEIMLALASAPPQLRAVHPDAALPVGGSSTAEAALAAAAAQPADDFGLSSKRRELAARRSSLAASELTKEIERLKAQLGELQQVEADNMALKVAR